ncbi:MAG: Txe/YoeB family addiction module toxin [Bacteroidales bacterium]
MYTVIITEHAQKDICVLEDSGKPAEINRLHELLKELGEHPQTGIGKPEELGGPLSGKWSRRISEKNRLVYQIDSEKQKVTVLHAIGHYSDH